jgi:peptidoglycan hydrolase-like protein with peptidoglycan-binding domain
VRGPLTHGWPPNLPEGDAFDPPTVEKTSAFQQACGLPQTGEADASTWHALDSFTRVDVPLSAITPIFDQNKAAMETDKTDPGTALPQFEAARDRAAALGLVEVVKNTEAMIGRSHHRMSHFPVAIEHYQLYLARNIPCPAHYGSVLELMRRAHEGLPADD